MRGWTPPEGVAVLEGVPLARRTTWRIGGAARWLVQPKDEAELRRVLASLPEKMPRLLLGGGSNLLLADAGLDGVGVDLTAGMREIRLAADDGEQVELEVQAGADVRHLAHVARQQGWSGAEFLAGIPGSVGGALRMNAGAYGGEMKQILMAARALDAEGIPQTLEVARMGLGYRTCGVPEGWIFTGARIRLRRDDPQRIRERMRGYNRQRAASQPLAWPSAGSTFRNPPGAAAWKLLEEAGMRGVRVGAAGVSEKHCNFFLNLGGATAREMRTLIDRARERVLQTSGVALQLEVRIITADGRWEEA